MAYAQNLHERVIAAVPAQWQPGSQIAQPFGVSESTVDKWAQRWRDTGGVAGLQWHWARSGLA